MTQEERGRGFGIHIDDVVVTTNGKGEQGIDLQGGIASTDPEMRDEAVESLLEFAEATGAELHVEEVKPNGGKSFTVGAKNWNATWQPQVPKPPWSAEDN